MLVSACSNVKFGNNLSMGNFTPQNYYTHTAAPTTQPAKSLKSNTALKTGAIAVLGVCTAAGSLLVLKHIKNPKHIFTPLPDENIAKSLPVSIKKELSYDNLYKKFTEFINNPDKECLNGIGANSSVYNIPFMDKYVLKVLKEKPYYDPVKVPVGIFPDNVNLGQPVWVHPENYRILLLKKVTGAPHSIENWSTTIYNPITQKPLPVTREQAETYFDKIIRISQMEQQVFDDLAGQIKVLDTTKAAPEKPFTGFKTDSINPNNLLVDFENKQMNIIDYFEKDQPEHQNSYMDMVSVITDFTLFPEYRDLLKPHEVKKLYDAVKIIDTKCFKAAENIGLSTDKQKYLDFVNFTNKYFHIESPPKPDGCGYYERQYDKSARAMVDLLAQL